MLRLQKPLLNFLRVSLAAFFACYQLSHAQLSVSIALGQTQFLAGEAVPCQITITNQTGSELILANFGRLPWLDITVESTSGHPATSYSQANPAPVNIPAGQSVAKTVDLNSLFGVREPGGYRVSVNVRTDATESNYTSNRISFNTIKVRPDWSQKIGINGTKETREFRLMNFTNNKQTMIYAQVIDGQRGTPMATLNLGKALLFVKPQAATDKQQNMHVLYLATPEFFLYARLDNNGRFLGRELYTKGPSGDPRLMTFADGSVKVAGGLKFDPDAVAQQKSKIRKLSDRPKYTYN